MCKKITKNGEEKVIFKVKGDNCIRNAKAILNNLEQVDGEYFVMYVLSNNKEEWICVDSGEPT